MERSLKCSMRREFGALAGGLDVMKLYLAQRRTSPATGNQSSIKFPLPLASASCTRASSTRASHDLGNAVTVTSERRLRSAGGRFLSTHNPPTQTAVREAKKANGEQEKKKAEEEVTVKVEADLEVERVLGDHEECWMAAIDRDFQLLLEKDKTQATSCSISDFIRKRHSEHLLPVRLSTQAVAHSKPKRCGLRLFTSNLDVPISTQVIHKMELERIAVEGKTGNDAPCGVEDNCVDSHCQPRHRMEEVGNGQIAQLTPFRSTFSKVYPQSPGKHHPKIASALRPKTTDSSTDLNELQSRTNAQVLMIDTRKHSLSETSLVRPVPSKGKRFRHVFLQSRFRVKSVQPRNLPQPTTSVNQWGSTPEPLMTVFGYSNSNGSQSNELKLENIDVVNIQQEKAYKKKPVLRSCPRIISGDFLMPPGRDGETKDSRVENYTKLDANKRFYLTFCQGMQKDEAPSASGWKDPPPSYNTTFSLTGSDRGGSCKLEGV